LKWIVRQSNINVVKKIKAGTGLGSYSSITGITRRKGS
jgi:hypothetical protein